MHERIVYVSRAAPGIVARDAYDIIRVSHNRNSQFGLTGALIFLDDYFLQVLEGEGYVMHSRFEAIQADSRHRELVVRQQRTPCRPTFPGEWMALRHGDDISDATKRAHGYMPGFSSECFDGDRLVAFALACCREHDVLANVA